MVEVSVIIPLFNEENSINELYRRINGVLTSLNKNYEIVFIDDGSNDRTYDFIRDIQIENACVRLVGLERNCGQLYAFLAGFEIAQGEIIITMDGDLQNDPVDIPKFLEKMAEGFDFVNGWRYNRKDNFARELISGFENWIIGARTGVRLHDYGCAFVATRREIIDKLKDYGTSARFIKPLIARLAGSITEIKIEHHPRKTGISKYSLFKIIKLGLDFIFNFNIKPIQIKLPRTVQKIRFRVDGKSVEQYLFIDERRR